MKAFLRYFLFAVLAMLPASAAIAAPVGWTDWTSTGPSTVSGTMTFGATTVGVTYSGPYYAPTTQVSGGTNYWSPSAPYISATVPNAPPASDIIALNEPGGLKTITFSHAVNDPLLALVSWNGNVVDFGVPIEILSFGLGHFGTGTATLNGGGTGFTGVGEFHGVIRLPGTYTSITFSDTSELWHGFTVGAVSVPEPSTGILLGIGLAGLLAYRRKRA